MSNEEKGEKGEIVMIESPYSGDIDRNVRYLQLAMLETGVIYGQLAYASHSYMTQHPLHKNYFVCDYNPKWDVLTRDQAIEMSQRMRHRCDQTIFYTDLGWSSGMKAALKYCRDHNLSYSERTLNAQRLSEKIPFTKKEFSEAIINKKEYKHFLEE